jgi:hypothetical protein
MTKQKWTHTRRSRAESLFSQAEILYRDQSVRLANLYSLLKWEWSSGGALQIPNAQAIQENLRRLNHDCKAEVLGEDPTMPMSVKCESGGLFVLFETIDGEMVISSGFVLDFTVYEGSNRRGRWDDDDRQVH